ncbi:hypothetical protein HanPSC8_Chr15g0682391 [Helianthus annuus]|nr:hypothetical protein HanPSC8_Chr15g0682391 [Helianthus annuus]
MVFGGLGTLGMIRNHPIDLFGKILENLNPYIKTHLLQDLDTCIQSFTTSLLRIPGAQAPFLVIISRA